MPKRLSDKEKNNWLNHCGWCNRRLGKESERIGIKAKFRDPKDYRKNEGRLVSFTLAEAGRQIAAYVVTRDAPAKVEGQEVIFQVCSERCGLELNEAMKKEMNLFS